MDQNEIDSHPLLDEDHRQACEKINGRYSRTYTMLEFSLYALRSAQSDYAALIGGRARDAAVLADLDHQRAAVLFVYQALKASTDALITESPALAEALQMLEIIHRDLPLPQ